MNSKTKAASVSIFLCTLACLMSLNAAQAQQAASSHFGASAPRPTSAIGGTVPVRGTGAGGGSSWGAGQGSFGNPAQPGGVWHDGSTLSFGTGIAHNTAQGRASGTEPFSAGGSLAAPSSGAKAPSFRGKVASGPAHLTRSSSIRGSASKSSIMGRAGGGSRSRAGSFGRGTGRGGTEHPSGLGSSLAQQGRPKESMTDSTLHDGLNPGLSK
jgi:endoglucanase